MSQPRLTTIVGLEVHVQLATESKLFCACPTNFGAPPNSQVCPVCLGEPGSLPVINRRAVQLAIKTGLALNCRIDPVPHWDRKHYFYPDLPKGYQTSQLDRPVCHEGELVVFDPKTLEPLRTVRIIRAHLEEDAGKSLHDEAGQGRGTRIDLNRAGTPLLEIVTHPDLRSGEEARLFLNELRLTLLDLGVSDCNMQEGSLRVDANVNVEVEEDSDRWATPIAEIKNLNSFRAVTRAIDYEARRQWEEWSQRPERPVGHLKETRGWNDATETTYLQRAKETSADYRYFPDPDLLPIPVDEDWVQTCRQQIPPPPSAARRELVDQYGLSPYDADVIVSQGRLFLNRFRELAEKVGQAKLVSNWLQQAVLRYLKEHQVSIDGYPVETDRFAEFLKGIAQGDVPSTRAQEILELMEGGMSIQEATRELGIQSVSDEELRLLCQNVLDESPTVANDLRQGNAKAVGALIGRARAHNPNADPRRLRELFLELTRER